MLVGGERIIGGVFLFIIFSVTPFFLMYSHVRIRGERFVITRAQTLDSVHYLCFRSPSWLLIGCGFVTAQPGGSGGCSIHEAVNAGVPAPIGIQGARGPHVELHGTLLGSVPGLLLATTNILEYIRAEFLFLLLCLCEIECMNPVTEGLQREKSQ